MLVTAKRDASTVFTVYSLKSEEDRQDRTERNGTGQGKTGGANANANGCLHSLSLSMGREIALLGGVLTASGSNKCQGSDWLPFEDRLVGEPR